MKEQITVIGAGLTGCSVALELASRDFEVILLDRHEEPMRGASSANEGKIHLGLVYAADSSFRTAELQLRGALTFSSLLRKWCGEQALSQLSISRAFVYLVDESSVFPQHFLEKHYRRVEDRFHQLLKRFPNLDYMGNSIESIWSELSQSQLKKWFSTRSTRAGYQTGELALDPDTLANLVRKRVLNDGQIKFQGHTDIQGITRLDDGFRLFFENKEENGSLHCKTLVNCTWESRLFFDRMLKAGDPGDFLHRLKYRVIADCPPGLRFAPSATRVLGRFGDVVVWPNGKVFLSWYPAGLKGWSRSILPPREWLNPMRGIISETDRNKIAEEIKAGIAAWYPGVHQVDQMQVDAGAILAWGSQDVDDRKSGLHARDRIQCRNYNGYWSVEPGKLTTAPLIGYECAERIVRDMESCEYAEPTFSDCLLDRIQRGNVHRSSVGVAG